MAMRLYKHIEPPPEDVYPIDDWQWIQSRLDPANVAQAETIFVLANGYIGMRGGFEEGRPTADDGTLVNGFFEFRIHELLPWHWQKPEPISADA
jgi:alpha,alpha-trehalose phosphorylase